MCSTGPALNNVANSELIMHTTAVWIVNSSYVTSSLGSWQIPGFSPWFECYPMRWWQLTDNKWRCSGCSTCLQHSTASITLFCCSDWPSIPVWYGRWDGVLQWMRSFVSSWMLQVLYVGQLSSVQPIQFSVPQGSVLGPLLFVMYTAELHQVVSNHGFILHQYADDCQVFHVCRRCTWRGRAFLPLPGGRRGLDEY